MVPLRVLYYKLDVNGMFSAEIKYSFAFLEGPGAMFGSAVIGGFILAMIEGTGILINRYSQMFMPQPGLEGKNTSMKKNSSDTLLSI